MVAAVINRAKVAIFGQNFAPEPSGNAPYTTSLARGLAADTAVRVITAQPYYPDWRVAPADRVWSRSERNGALRVDRKLHYVPKNPTLVRRLLSEVSFGLRVLTSRWGRPDAVVLVSPSLFACVLIAPVAKFRGLPTLLWVQDLYTRGLAETGQSGGLSGRLMRIVESSLMRTVDHIAVIHESFEQFVVDELGVPADHVTVIRNWSHIAVDDGQHDRASTRARMGWSDDDIVVLHAGNMGVKQGLSNVVAAARVADQRSSNVRFVLLGGGNQLNDLREQARGISRIEFLASLPDSDYAAVLQAADILLVNEKTGVSGMSVPSKLTSYYATGLPVLAAVDPESVTAAEVRTSGGGVVVASGDPSALVDAAAQLGTDRELSVTLGANGQRFRLEHLTQAAGVDRFRVLIRTLIGARESEGA